MGRGWPRIWTLEMKALASAFSWFSMDPAQFEPDQSRRAGIRHARTTRRRRRRRRVTLAATFNSASCSFVRSLGQGRRRLSATWCKMMQCFEPCSYDCSVFAKRRSCAMNIR